MKFATPVFQFLLLRTLADSSSSHAIFRVGRLPGQVDITPPPLMSTQPSSRAQKTFLTDRPMSSGCMVATHPCFLNFTFVTLTRETVETRQSSVKLYSLGLMLGKRDNSGPPQLSLFRNIAPALNVAMFR
jgi:hypothetical protein